MGKNDQLFKKRKAATEESLRRRSVEREPATRILIACEGEETERRYFQALISSLALSGVDVEICDECDSAPISVVQYAEAKARSQGTPEDGGYAQVFCVFDRDAHETYEAAKSKVLTLDKSETFPTRIKSIVTIPCIEFWFILHFKLFRSPFVANGGKSVGDLAVSALKEIKGFEKYEKSISSKQVDALVEKIDAALYNAKLCMADAIATGEENPSTTVDELVHFLKQTSADAKIEAAKSL